jgi:hypothetical protein
MATAPSTDQRVRPDPATEHPASFYAAPTLGNYTNDAHAHLEMADALAAIISGEGFDHFSQMNDEIQHSVLYLLRSEIGRAKRSMEAELAEKHAQGNRS